MIQIWKQGNRFTLNGKVVQPREFVGRNGFKFVNHVAAWARGSVNGLDNWGNMRRYIEEAIVGLGCKWMRAPTELEFWGPPYFDHPDYPNERGLWNLGTGTGSGFVIPDIQKKIIRMYVVLARKYDIVIQVPWLWTIKGEGDDDPRRWSSLRRDVSVWNEHLIANVGRYLHQLKTEGDGEGEHRVDPGPLNILSSIANEYRVHADEFTDVQISNICRRWKTRDNPGELLSLSQSQPKHEFWPSTADVSHIELHPKRDGEWWKTGAELHDKFGRHLVLLDESMLYITPADRAEWVPKIPKWAGLGSSDLGHYMEMHADFWDHGLYSCFHDFESMGAGWHGGYRTSDLDGAISDALGGVAPPPPPPENQMFERIIVLAYEQILGRLPDEGGLAHYNSEMKSGMSEAGMREDLLRSEEYAAKNPEENNFVWPPKD